MSSTSSFYTIINDCWDTANHALKVVLNMVHTHISTAQGGTLDHGAALTGLTDDDHTQYVLADGTRTLTVAAIAPSTPATGDLWIDTS